MPNDHLKRAYDLGGPKQAEEFYDDWAKTYEAEVGKNGYVTPGRCVDALLKLDPTISGPVIDLGCGTGLGGLALRKAGFQPIDGLDFSEGMLEVARVHGVYRELWQGDLSQPVKSDHGPYAHALAAGVLNPGHAPPVAVGHALDLLPAGGVFVFSLNDHALADQAFTGAVKDHKGKFEQAHEGTLFLDEIAELSLPIQAKLLRVLQEGKFEPVGASELIDVDVRIVAATNRNLASMVKNGSFRADLFYRLNVIPLTVPPLRKRKEDIPLLASHFIDKFCKLYGREKPLLTDAINTFLMEHEWKGNIRELQNTMERFVVLGHLHDDAFDHLERNKSDHPDAAEQDLLVSLEEVERDHLIKVLTHCRWRVSGKHGAAAILKLNPSTLRFRMQKLGISKSKQAGPK